MSENSERNDNKLRVINIGLPFFYEALKSQECKAVQIDWNLPVKRSAAVTDLLHVVNQDILKNKIRAANDKAVQCIIDSDPVWTDILPAGEVVEGLEDYTILHSGPPIGYDEMVMLHQRGLISACLFEGWAETQEEALECIKSGKIKVLSALDTNTVGAGTGIITKSVAMMIIEDRSTGIRVGTFPAEGQYQGGFCGWGLYSSKIAENLRYMREELFPVLRRFLKEQGPIPIKPILAESMQMGDENHTRQTAAGLLFEHRIIPDLMKLDLPKEKLISVMNYIMDTPRFFHCYGQGASRCGVLSASGIPYSTMVTAFCGNGVTFGIKVSGLGEEWFTAPAPMMEGRYTSSKYTRKDQLPWLGDSCIVECAGMGGMAAAASPIVCSLRGLKANEAIDLTRMMEKICISQNPMFPIPNMNFDFLPVGIDIRKVLEYGIAPEIHGGIFNYEGGLIGAGSTRVPMECFEKAMEAYVKKYGGDS